MAFLPQRKRFKVFPLVCKTEFTQTAIAAASLAADVFFTPGRSFIVFRTRLIHRQKSAAVPFFRVAILLRHTFFRFFLRDGYLPSQSLIQGSR
jgi:hypothetical protein